MKVPEERYLKSSQCSGKIQGERQRDWKERRSVNRSVKIPVGSSTSKNQNIALTIQAAEQFHIGIILQFIH